MCSKEGCSLSDCSALASCDAMAPYGAQAPHDAHVIAYKAALLSQALNIYFVLDLIERSYNVIYVICFS